MPQSKLVDIKPSEYGTVVTLEDFEGNQKSFVYDGDLSIDKLNKLKGCDLSFNIKGETQLTNVHKAWDKAGKTVHSTIPYDGDDRATR